MPLITTAIHAGHDVRDELKDYFSLTDAERLKEEDPYTDEFAAVSGTQIIGTKSRFEIDLNRPRSKAVYLRPEDAWGLKVWKRKLKNELLEKALVEYDLFYEQVQMLLDDLLKKFKYVIVLDIHSYNHRRNGPDIPFADPSQNPEIVLGTRTMQDRNKWSSIIDCCQKSLSSYNFLGRTLGVRENIKFPGGYFPKWIHQHYEDSVCCISIELKKTYMNEWTGEPDILLINEIKKLVKNTVNVLLQKINSMNNQNTKY